jgi:hypothetical protein
MGRGGGNEGCAGGLYGLAIGTGPPWDGRGWKWDAGISKTSELAEDEL